MLSLSGKAVYLLLKMANRVRCKGRFITKSKLRWLENVKKAATLKQRNPPFIENTKSDGRRVIDLDYLFEGLWCHHFKQALTLRDRLSEKKMGLASIFKVKCSKCNAFFDISTSRSSSTKNFHKVYDVNCKMALGTYEN